MRTTKEDVEDASGGGEQECWFGDKGYHESSKGVGEIAAKRVNSANPVYGDKPGSKLDWIGMRQVKSVA